MWNEECGMRIAWEMGAEEGVRRDGGVRSQE